MADPLLTPRLRLREFAPEDFEALREIDADPEVLRWRSRPVITPEMTREFLAQSAAAAEGGPRQLYAFAVTLRADGRLVGQCGLTIVNKGYDEAFLWYSLNRQFWGQGYTTEAARRVLQFGLETAGLRRIFAECKPENLASARVMEKIGLRPESLAPGSGAEAASRVRAALTAEEWAADSGGA